MVTSYTHHQCKDFHFLVVWYLVFILFVVCMSACVLLSLRHPHGISAKLIILTNSLQSCWLFYHRYFFIILLHCECFFNWFFLHSVVKFHNHNAMLKFSLVITICFPLYRHLSDLSIGLSQPSNFRTSMPCLLFCIIVQIFIISLPPSCFLTAFSVPFIYYLALVLSLRNGSSYDVTSIDIFPNTWNWSMAARVIMHFCKASYFLCPCLISFWWSAVTYLSYQLLERHFFGITLAYHEISYSHL